jgi:hypothetical protein
MRYAVSDFVLRLMRKKVIVITTDYVGIGNRIKQLASYHICFGLNNTTLIWNKQGWVNKGFDELFQLEEICGFRALNVSMPGLWPIVISYPARPEFKERGYWRFFVDMNDVPESFNITRNGSTYPVIDFRYHNIPDKLIHKYREFFSRLKPSSAVNRRLKELNITNEIVCVQVRNSKDKKDHARVPEIGSFIKIMNTYPSDTRFFISAMDSSYAIAFTKVFGDRVFELPGKDYRSMVDAVTDMYALSMGRELILSEGSTFPEISWWLGSCSQPVTIVPVSYKQ